jgi:hypothetical protein
VINISPFRVNQAGYRPGDKKFFYYVGSASSFSVVKATDVSVVATGTLLSTGGTTSVQMKITGCSDALTVSAGAINYTLSCAVTSGTIFEGSITDLPEGYAESK